MIPSTTNGAALAVSLRAVTKRFGSVDAVRSLDLDVRHGELVGLLGPNGAGKSTAIRMIMSLIRPDSGELRVFDADALDMKDRIGYLPEERGLYRRMRVGEFLEYIGRLKGLPRTGLNTRVARWLERIELPGVIRSRCHELSKGMQQKVQFISAVLHEPDLIVLDEPFSGLDPVNARVLIDVVRELHSQGKTIFLSTHQMTQAEQLCDRVILINRGEKLLDAPTREVLAQHSPRAIELFPIGTIDDARLQAARMSEVESVRAGSTPLSLLLGLKEGPLPHELMTTLLESIPCRRIEVAQVSLDDVFVRLVTAHGGHARIPVGASR